MGLIWTGKPWREQERDRPTVDPRFYEAMRRAGVQRVRGPRADFRQLAGLVGLIAVAVLMVGGVFFWLGAVGAWLNNR